ncbi:MAG: hypothetical protein JWO58_3282, partial [Chitinophagaceae bacterium]|nr:hypothetical protein [Chitinophagaceae bacterium]
MSDTELSERQAVVLEHMAFGTEYAAESLMAFFDAPPAPATLRRDMQQLESLGLVLK